MNGLTVQKQDNHQHPSRRPKTSSLAAMIVAASLGVTVLSACGGSDSTTASSESSSTSASASSSASASATTSTSAAATPDAAKLLQESARTTETLQSLHLVLTATDMAKLPVSSVIADVSNQPVGNGQAVGEAKFRATPDASFTDTSFLVTDKTFYTKSPEGAYTSVGPAQKIYDPAVVLDKEKGLANIIKQVKDPKVEGKETIDGVASVKVSGTIDSAVVDPVVPTLGQGGGTLPITLWIADVAPAQAPATTLPSDAPSPGTGPNLVQVSVKKDPGSVDVTLSAWAKPVEIPKP